MKQNSNNSEVQNLLSLILQDGKIMVAKGQLLIGPSEIARKFGDQIGRLKPELLIALGCCPTCAGELVVRVEELEKRTGRHAHCQTVGHYDRWEF